MENNGLQSLYFKAILKHVGSQFKEFDITI
jgi:hypothetical protein